MSAYTGRGVGSDISGGVIELHGCDVAISGGAEGRIGGGHLPLSIGRFQGEGAPALRSIRTYSKRERNTSDMVAVF